MTFKKYKLKKGDIMSIFEYLIINLIFLLFPFLIYIIYINYKRSTKEKNIVLDITIISSLFLMLRYTPSKTSIASLILMNFPLLVAFTKKRTIVSIVLIIITIYNYTNILNIPIIFEVIEYSIYFTLYLISKKKENTSFILNIFISIKSFLTAIFLTTKLNSSFNLLQLLFTICLLIITMSSILMLLKEGKKMLDKNKILIKMEKEKNLKVALFKLTHEIKNPIAVCKGYLEMIDINNKDKLNKYLPIIKDEINRTLLIINDFSDYGKLKIEKEEVDLVVLLEDVKNTLLSLLLENKVELNIDVKEEEIYIDLDYERIKQVLINLIKNSLEAKDERRKLKITITIEKIAKYYKIKVIDTGMGITRDNLKKITQIFYTTKENGTGLGVSLSKDIIEGHGGSMKYSSKVGKGTKVTILLPRKN